MARASSERHGTFGVEDGFGARGRLSLAGASASGDAGRRVGFFGSLSHAKVKVKVSGITFWLVRLGFLETVFLLEGLNGVQNHEGNHGVRGDANVVRRETGVKLEGTAGSHRLAAAVDETGERKLAIRTRLLLLQLSLDVVKRKGEEGGKEAGDGGGAERRRETSDVVLLHHFLGLVVGREHTHVERHGANRGGTRTGEESADTVLLHNIHESVTDAVVVASLIRRKRTIRLHTNERKIRRRTNERTQTTRGQTSASLLSQAQVSTVVLFLEHLHELRVQTETRRRVRRLAKQARRETRVKRAETFVLNDGRRSADRTSRGSELKANLDDCLR